MRRPLTYGSAVVGLLVCLLLPGASFGGEPLGPDAVRWVPFHEGRERPKERGPRTDVLRVVESRAERLTIGADLAGMELATAEAADGRTYTRVSTPGAGLAWEGGPDLPVFGRWILVPTGAMAVLEIEPGEAVVLDHVLVAPLQPLWPDVEEEPPRPPFSRDEAVYGADRIYPAELARLEPVVHMAGQSCAILWLQPFRHNPVRQTLEVYPDIRVTVRFEGGTGPLPPRFDESPFATILGRLAVNSEAVLAAERAAWEVQRAQVAEEPRADRTFSGWDHMIIAHPKFKAAANKLAAWRKKTGQSVFVAVYNWTGGTVHCLISQFYDGWPGKLKYVTLIGDAEYVPTRYYTWHTWNSMSGIPSQGYIGTDLYYATMGYDYFPDLALGRIASTWSADPYNMVSRIIDYEKNPPTVSSFYTSATLCGYFQDGVEGLIDPDDEADRRFAQTTEDLAIFLSNPTHGINKTVDRIYYAKSGIDPQTWCSGTIGGQPNFTGLSGAPGANIPTYLRKPGFAWDGDAADIGAAVVAGTFLLTHRDHGSRKSWSHPNYEWTDVLHLSVPVGKPPVIWSINCKTGWFDNETDFVKKGISDQTYSWDESFVENWLNSTPTGGPVGVIGSTRVSESYYNDRLMWGLTDAIWPGFLTYNPAGASGPIRTMGDVLNYAKVYMATTVVDNAWRKAHFEMYHWFGDPSMRIRVNRPLNVIAELPSLWNWMLFPNTWSATVTWAEGPLVGQTVDKATLTITKDDAPDDYWVATTDESGQVVFDDLQTTTQGEYEVVITAPDAIPYIGTFVSEPSSTGGVVFDQEVYACSSVIGIKVADEDLSESVQVVVSTPGGDEEWVTLVETGGDTGIFEGSLDAVPGTASPDSGFLELNHGDEISVEYEDLDDGFRSSGWVADTAVADCEAPAFDGLPELELTESLVVLYWDSGEDEHGAVTYKV